MLLTVFTHFYAALLIQPTPRRTDFHFFSLFQRMLPATIMLVSACTPTAQPDPTATPIPSNNSWTAQTQLFDTVPMAYVPPGCFIMGRDDGRRDERPAHTQCFARSFWIDVTEVTNAAYGSDGPYPGPKRPRSNITWADARDFCAARGARLPTEREWEYAARGVDSWLYPWGNFYLETFFNNDRRNLETSDTGTFVGGKSWVGAHDMAGNVWEWTASLYRPYPYDSADGRETSTDPIEARVYRGGWLTYQDGGASAVMRFRGSADKRDWRLGFRCARDA